MLQKKPHKQKLKHSNNFVFFCVCVCVCQACLTLLDEECVFNPLSLISNLYQHLRSRGLHSQPRYPYRSDASQNNNITLKNLCNPFSLSGNHACRGQSWGKKTKHLKWLKVIVVPQQRLMITMMSGLVNFTYLTQYHTHTHKHTHICLKGFYDVHSVWHHLSFHSWFE